jgi:hypothetical protein
MLKRRIAVLIAGILFGTQAGMAAEEEEMFSTADNGEYAVQESTENVPTELAVTEVPAPVVAYPEPESAVAPTVVTNPPARTTRSETFPPSADDMIGTPLPAQAKYLDERAAHVQLAVRGDAFPQSANDLAWKPLPAQAKYLDQRGARVQQALRDNTIAPSADDLAWKLRPAQVSYFDQKAGRINVSRYGSPSSGSIE